MAEFGVGDRGATVSQIQRALDYLGYDLGTADGIFGPRTRLAVQQFQVDTMVTGRVDVATHANLKTAVMTEKARRAMNAVPRGLAEIEKVFGKIEYVEGEGGYVEITNDWAKQHLVTISLPIVGKTAVHKRLVDIFRDALTEVANVGLGDEIKQWGVWCPRHKLHNPNRGLSTHSWAIACDINWAENPVGRVGKIDQRIVRIFKIAGFNWGGDWRTRDDMHFQYCQDY